MYGEVAQRELWQEVTGMVYVVAGVTDETDVYDDRLHELAQ